MTPAFLFVMSRHDISDEKWAVIGPLLEKKKTETRGRKRKDDRLMFNGILWILKTGAPWRDLPAEFGPWNTVHKRFLEWARLEVWDDILRMLSIKAERDALIIDATFIRVHQHATGAKGGHLAHGASTVWYLHHKLEGPEYEKR